jgi:hypothetical protein
VPAYIQHLPSILSNARCYAGREAIAEQAIIRANNPLTSPVVFLDRQIQVPGIRKKMDLVGLMAPSEFVITEVKQGLDNRIQHLMDQIHRYYLVLAGQDGCLRPEVVRSYNRVIQQKQSLSLLQENHPPLSHQTQVTCLLVLYGYNHRSQLLARLRAASAEHSLTVALIILPEGSYTLPARTNWEQLCPAK